MGTLWGPWAGRKGRDKEWTVEAEGKREGLGPLSSASI